MHLSGDAFCREMHFDGRCILSGDAFCREMHLDGINSVQLELSTDNRQSLYILGVPTEALVKKKATSRHSDSKVICQLFQLRQPPLPS
jgi:hypothetical protein